MMKTCFAFFADATPNVGVDDSFIWRLSMFLFLLLFALFAFYWIIAAHSSIRKFGRIKEFYAKRDRWKPLIIKKTLPQQYSVGAMAELRFEELSQATNATDRADAFNEIRNKRFGKIMTMVFHKERALETLVWESRLYCGAFLALLIFGVLYNADKFVNKSLAEFTQYFFSNHIVPFFEAVVLIFLLIRFFVEMRSLKELMED